MSASGDLAGEVVLLKLKSVNVFIKHTVSKMGVHSAKKMVLVLNSIESRIARTRESITINKGGVLDSLVLL